MNYDYPNSTTSFLHRLDSQRPGGLSIIIVFSLAVALVVTGILWSMP